MRGRRDGGRWFADNHLPVGALAVSVSQSVSECVSVCGQRSFTSLAPPPVKDRSVREGNWRDRDDATGGLQNRETLWYPGTWTETILCPMRQWC